MNLSVATQRTEQALMRIVALLFSLAALTGRMADLPRPLRFILFAVMNRAHGAARGFVEGIADDLGWTLVIPHSARQFPDDGAARMRDLAESFKLLAQVLEDLVTQAAGLLAETAGKDPIVASRPSSLAAMRIAVRFGLQRLDRRHRPAIRAGPAAHAS